MNSRRSGVLLVCDDESVAAIITDSLELHGYSVTAVPGIRAAVQSIEDVGLPHLLVVALRDRLPDTEALGTASDYGRWAPIVVVAHVPDLRPAVATVHWPLNLNNLLAVVRQLEEEIDPLRIARTV